MAVAAALPQAHRAKQRRLASLRWLLFYAAFVCAADTRAHARTHTHRHTHTHRRTMSMAELRVCGRACAPIATCHLGLWLFLLALLLKLWLQHAAQPDRQAGRHPGKPAGEQASKHTRVAARRRYHPEPTPPPRIYRGSTREPTTATRLKGLSLSHPSTPPAKLTGSSRTCTNSALPAA